MKSFYIFFFCLFVTLGQSQTVYKYYVYLNDSTLAPEFKKSGYYSTYSGLNSGLNNFFKNYNIINFDKAFPASNWESLSRVLILETENSTLASDLLTNYPSVYRKFDDLTNDKVELTSYPNDYGSTNPTPIAGATINRNDLDYINVSKAWDITTGDGMIIGISDARINTTDIDFSNKISFINPNSYQSLPYSPTNMYTSHGTTVAGIAAAQGGNSHGSTGVCQNCRIVGTALANYNNLLVLAQNGIKVINMSWLTHSSTTPYFRGSNAGYEAEQTVIDSIVRHYRVVLVAGSGNVSSYQTNVDKHCGGTGYTGINYFYPASYDGVISVSTTWHQNPLILPLSTSASNYAGISPTGLPLYTFFQGSVGNCVDGTNPNSPLGLIYNGWAEYCGSTISSPNGLVPFETTNPLVDILSPTHNVFNYAKFAEEGIIEYSGGGTSCASPFVSGTAALMLSVNGCLYPNEVDNVLKLTSKDVEQLSFNQIFQGQIGAGVLDAGDAVTFVNEMKKPDGNAVIKNHIFNRFDFNLEKINNNLIINNASFINNNKSYFKAKNQIQLLPGTHLYPNASGSVYLGINPLVDINCTPVSYAKNTNETEDIDKLKSSLILFPNPTTSNVYFNNTSYGFDAVSIYNYLGQEVATTRFTSFGANQEIDMSALAKGVYILKFKGNQESQSVKIIKE